MANTPMLLANGAHLEDEEVVRRVLAGDTALFEILMRRYNQLLYRVSRSILRNDAEAEDVMQEAYVRAYEHLHQFAGRAQFRTWLTRIAVHEALARAERGKRFEVFEPPTSGDVMDDFASPRRSPEQQAADAEVRQLIERAISQLPDLYRSVFMLRDVEQMSIEDVARILDLTESTVKVRLHRARRALRKTILGHAGEQLWGSFPFDAVRCDRVVARVFARINQKNGVWEAAL
ncbi:MAG TPA: RNA polymerase sigma factor [Terriglobales bacterium]|nr:RNA polymerase sigma factor [Terriglobales bacterium]